MSEDRYSILRLKNMFMVIARDVWILKKDDPHFKGFRKALDMEKAVVWYRGRLTL